MQFILKYSLYIAVVVVAHVAATAQTPNDTIKNTITVVKPFTPSIQDAFKISQYPRVDETLLATKRKINYSIFSVPVASTFTPAKGTVATLERQPNEKLYDNYASIGGGSFTNILADLYINHSISRTDRIGGRLNHHSSQGGIDGVVLEDKFYDTELEINYSKVLRDQTWNASVGGLHKIYNWYGIPDLIKNLPGFSPSTEVDHTYYGAFIKGDVTFNDATVNKAGLDLNYFADGFDASEYHALGKTAFLLPITNDNPINLDMVADYVSGSFDENQEQTNSISYANLVVKALPSYSFSISDFDIKLGAKAVFYNNSETGNSVFKAYPDVKVSYAVVKDVVAVYAGVNGDLKQQSYQQFVNENPYLSPTLTVLPTDVEYNAFAGISGKISQNASYRFLGSYTSEKEKPLFLANAARNFSINKVYGLGNSFGVIYDEVSTFSALGELEVAINQNFSLTLTAEYFNYDLNTQEEAWNLPDFKGSLLANYQISKRLLAGANLFYVGKRHDLNSGDGLFTPFTDRTKISLDAYLDANLHISYQLNNRIILFAKANNFIDNYNKWQNYPVQDALLLAGLSYKFNL